MGTYSIVAAAYHDGYVGSSRSYKTFTITVTDPCEDDTLVLDPILDMTVNLGSEGYTDWNEPIKATGCTDSFNWFVGLCMIGGTTGCTDYTQQNCPLQTDPIMTDDMYGCCTCATTSSV